MHTDAPCCTRLHACRPGTSCPSSLSKHATAAHPACALTALNRHNGTALHMPSHAASRACMHIRTRARVPRPWSLPGRLAVRADALGGGAEPLVEAGAVEALGAGVAPQPRQLPITRAHHCTIMACLSRCSTPEDCSHNRKKRWKKGRDGAPSPSPHPRCTSGCGPGPHAAGLCSTPELQGPWCCARKVWHATHAHRSSR